MNDLKFFALAFCIIFTIINLGTRFLNWINFSAWRAAPANINNGDMLFAVFMFFLAGFAAATVTSLVIYKNEK